MADTPNPTRWIGPTGLANSHVASKPAATPTEIMVEAILAREWWDHEKAAHKFHAYDSGCAVCGGWVEPMIAEALRGLDMADLIVVAACSCGQPIGTCHSCGQPRCYYCHPGLGRKHTPMKCNERHEPAALPKETDHA